MCVCVCVCERVTQSCPTLSDPVDCNPSGSSVHGVIQARIPEWVAFPSPGDLPDSGTEPRSPALQADSLLSEPPGNSWWDSNLGPNRGLHGQILCCVTFTHMNTCVSCDPQETRERAGFAPFCRKMRKLAPEGQWLCRVTGPRWLRPQRVRGGTLSLSPLLCPLSPLSPRQRLRPGAAGSVPGPAGTMGAACSRHPGPGRVGVGRSGDLESCKLETCQ